MNNFRSKSSNNRYGGNDVKDYSFNQQAGATKSMSAGLGKVTILGALNTAKNVSDLGRLVAVFNNSSSVAFVATGDSAVAAPTGGANGICLPPYAYTVIALTTDTWIRASAATCFGYEIVDDLMYNPNSGSNQ